MMLKILFQHQTTTGNHCSSRFLFLLMMNRLVFTFYDNINGKLDAYVLDYGLIQTRFHRMLSD